MKLQLSLVSLEIPLKGRLQDNYNVIFHNSINPLYLFQACFRGIFGKGELNIYGGRVKVK
jgi:hypothetical protein